MEEVNFLGGGGGMNELDVVDLGSFGGGGSSSSSSSGVNFGGGIEMLMNEKRKSSSSSSSSHRGSMNLGELDNLEKELNELSGNTGSGSGSGSGSGFGGGSGSGSGSGSGGGGGGGGFLDDFSTTFSSFMNIGTASTTPVNENTRPIAPGSAEQGAANLGAATKESSGGANTKTWDGFAKLNEVPLASTMSGLPKLSEREKRRKKRAMIKKLDEWHEKGLLKHSSHFNLDSDFDEVEDEYETALDEKRKKDSIKLQGWWFMTFINSVEYANTVFNPFDLNLDGWGEQISEDIDSYDEIFNELHDKYKGGKISPEISLLLRVGFSAAVVNITNKALSTATPGFNDIIKQSPELMKMFTNATVQTLNKENSLGSMMNSFMSGGSTPGGGKPGNGGGGGGMDQGVANLFGPPPKPVDTKTFRPDAFFNTAGGNGGNGGQNGNGNRVKPLPPYPPVPPSSSSSSSSSTSAAAQKNATNSYQSRPDLAVASASASASSSVSRSEMKGPQNTDLDEILSGLKRKETMIQYSEPAGGGGGEDEDEFDDQDTFSITSDFSLTAMNGGGEYGGGEQQQQFSSSRPPSASSSSSSSGKYKSSQRKQKPRSDKNIVSISDI